ncbi:mycofactocin system glycosyltransferase [Aeromicrobium sp. A1-2]|uniref:mycofactocin biosynthesis glycosyltransferase MftF n=1 Tax=Aeromicrobium sp. A1-2 TaxID=2107713 RepID=UPI000E481E17|nr:mycofactocin biosynthesis glycosyltransferase MftF [Aeromicrobium sp. A1-2]AXT84274.1 mycofactocin system glycosyltransferase [Aeromicrobium sp. A1-2]
MTDPPLPLGFTVRLHDEVELVGQVIVGPRVLRLSAAARQLIVDREVTVSSSTSALLADRLLDLDIAEPVIDRKADQPLDELTVVVPVRDNAAGVERLLRGLAQRVRCVVVDDASADPRRLAGIVAEYRSPLVRLDHNVGPAAARNAGLHQVATPFVAFVDSDVMVSAESLADLTRHFVDPRLAAVAPRVKTPPGGRWFQRYEAASGSLDLGPSAATVRPWTPVTYVPSACLLARVDALGAGFDPLLRSGEDVDLIWRLQADGHRVRYAAEVTVDHDARDTVAGWLGRKTFYGTSAAPLAQRHGNRVAPAVFTRALATTAMGVLLQRRWSWAVAVVGAADFARTMGSGLSDLTPGRRAQVIAATGTTMARQVPSLMLRHWWPVSIALALVSSRARRALATAAVLDGVLAHRASGAKLDPVRYILARRADDVAYGAGVWQGAVRQRSVRCLLPRWMPPRRSEPDT